MEGKRWWDLAVVASAAISAAFTIADNGTPTETVGGLLALAAFAAAWFAIGRRANRGFAIGFLVAIIVIMGIGTTFDPWVANMQVVAVPMIWSLSDGIRRAVVGNVVLVVVVTIGLYLSSGATTAGLGRALIVEAISLAFAISFGLWIHAIYVRSFERQRLLDELRAAQDSLAALSRDAGVASERERLAREIHDTIAQDLTGLVMLAQRAQRELSSGASPSDTLGMLEESARTALAETRALVASGAPVALNGGISDALDRLGERFARETGLTVTVAADGLPGLDRDTEVVLLRCAQEGLANVRKHSAGRAASVSAWADNGSVALRVTDDGTGFDPDAATDGFGLDGMRSRLALVGGALDISSSPAGTVLTATLPLRVSA